MKFSNEKEFEQVNVFGKGEPNVVYAKYFIGDSFLNPVTSAGCGVHLTNAKKHGVTAEEMAEIITHAAFYAGWPNAWATFNLAKEVYDAEA